MNKVEHALALAEMGFYVFPCKPQEKTPAIKGWQDAATTDPEQVKALWDLRPNANIGIYTAKYGHDGQALLVIDIDNKNGHNGNHTLLDLTEDGCRLGTTISQTTPSGGSHLIYQVSEAVSSGAGVLGTGLDIRSAGGYIVGPGSTTDQGEYQWNRSDGLATQADLSLVKLCRQSKPRDPNAQVPLVDEDQKPNIARAIDYLQQAEPAFEGAGGDARAYKVACGVRDLSVSEPRCLELMLDHWNKRCSPPWQPEELANKVNNAYRYAKERPGVATAQADFAKSDDDAQATPKYQLMPPPKRDRLLALLDRDDLIEDWLLPGQCSLLLGPSNVGKTFVALDMLYAVARGMTWFDKITEQRTVVYIAAEGAVHIELRLLAYQQHHDLADEDLDAIPLRTLAAPINLRDPETDTGWLITKLKEAAEQTGYPLGLVVVDTLSRAMAGGNENSAEDVSAYLRNSDRIREETGAHVMHVHHLGKDAAKGARGSSALKAGVDTEILVTRTGDGTGRIKVTKQRDIMGTAQAMFRLVPVTLGENKYGKSVTSCVLHQRSEAEQGFSKSDLTDGSKEKLALDFLSGLINEKGEEAPTETGAPAGGRVVPEQLWREMCVEQLSGGVLESRKRVFRDARTNLQKGGHIGREGKYVWISP